MTPFLSVYFDLARFIAAAIVLLSHVTELYPTGLPMPFPGKDAVIVFFVLSGYVIAFVADTKEHGWRDFAFSRYTRLISVYFPAVVLSLVVVAVERFLSRNAGGTLTELVQMLFINIFFLGQIWFHNITPPHNNPAWSINYEAWYYLVFGLYFYSKNSFKWIAVIVAAICAGPKILILMPCWIAGCVLYYNRSRLAIRPHSASLLFAVSLVAYAVYFFTDFNVNTRIFVQGNAPLLMAPLQWSNRFLGDYILCGIVILNFISIMSIKNRCSEYLLQCKSQIKLCASYTLSIYLYHYPLAILIGIAMRPFYDGKFLAAIALILLVPSILVLGTITELKLSKLRINLKRRFPPF